MHEINRTGTMLDNVIYYNITLPHHCFDKMTLDELLPDASDHASLHAEGVVFKHLIVPMKRSPLPVIVSSSGCSDTTTATYSANTTGRIG